ncbi:hypothetical protein K8Q94_02435 [Candidatus Nomurabacteria bacterium]|nr:hypothetical protein [Candidatus Nomurabacteria bacterium]
MITKIYECDIENNGDVDHALEYLRNHWNDSYVLDFFENAKTSSDYKADMKIQDVNGTYVLKYISPHYYSLEWHNY